MIPNRTPAMICLSAMALMVQPMVAGPKIWVFNGDPGDGPHHEKYEKLLAGLRKSLTSGYKIPTKDVKVFYGPRDAGYEGICTKETLLDELKKAAAATHDESCSSVWIILQGHANSIPGAALFNLPGPDASQREMATALKEAAADKPMVIFATTTASHSFVKALAAPGRIVVTANSPGDEETETDYPGFLAETIAAKATDADNNGFVSVTEIFTACHSRIEQMNNKAGYVILEHSQMDGNGDGRATNRPAMIDAEPGSKVGLYLGGEKSAPGKPGGGFD